jgi:hypothetical protein
MTAAICQRAIPALRHDERVTDTSAPVPRLEPPQYADQFPIMLEHIGRIAMYSADLSVSLLQFAAAVMGSDLTYALLEDSTLGGQFKQVRGILAVVNGTAARKAAAVTDETKASALTLLDACEAIVKYRNRLIHDVWTPQPDPRRSDVIVSRRATRWSRESVTTTIESLGILAGVINEACVSFSALEDQVLSERSGQRPMRQVGSRFDVMLTVARIDSLRTSKQAGWLWQVTPATYR